MAKAYLVTATAVQARAESSANLNKVEAGEEVIITRRGKAVAEVRPLPKKREPLPLEELAAFSERMPSLGKPSVELIREMRDEGL